MILGDLRWKLKYAYYLKHQNRRGDSVAAWRNVLDWDRAEKNFTS